jgi:hypothetical protein
MPSLMPSPTEAEAWVFTRRARGSNDTRGEGAPQRCLHGVEVHPKTPSSSATTEVGARLSPGAHQTQNRRSLSPKLAEAMQSLQTVAAHHHHLCERLHHITSLCGAPRQSSRRTPGAAALASSSLAEREMPSSPETQSGHHLSTARCRGHNPDLTNATAVPQGRRPGLLERAPH